MKLWAHRLLINSDVSLAPVTRPLAVSAARVTELDGLRGVAILLVLFVHYYVQQFSDAFRGVAPDFFEFCISGSAGVDLFFVISGFLIGGILLSHVTSIASLKAFYMRRAWRIWPLYYLLLIVAFTSSIGTTDVSFRVSWISYLFFFQNISISLGNLSVPILAPLWSLAVEEHFYLVAPLASRFLNRRNLLRIAAALVVLPPMIRMAMTSSHFAYRHQFAYNFTLCRMDAIGAGLLGAILWENPAFKQLIARHRAPFKGLVWILGVGAVAVCVPAILRLGPWIKQIKMTWHACFFLSVVLLVVSDRDCGLAKVLRLAPLRFAGVRCYFLYVFHMALLSVTPMLFSNAQLATALALTLCFVYAEISWRYVERPLIGYSYRWKYETVS